MPTSKTISGIHIQWPWSRLILSGKKTIETRSYKIPAKYIGQELAIIETPGPKGKKSGVNRSMIIGTVTFNKCYQYVGYENWTADQKRHLVKPDDPLYAFKPNKDKWAWVIGYVSVLKLPKPPPKKRGITWVSNCKL